MAYCPDCSAEMPTTAVECPNCGYDWSRDKNPADTAGWEYSALADTALLVGALVSALGCFVSLAYGLYSFAQSRWIQAAVLCPIAFLYQFGLMVVFLRVGSSRR